MCSESRTEVMLGMNIPVINQFVLQDNLVFKELCLQLMTGVCVWRKCLNISLELSCDNTCLANAAVKVNYARRREKFPYRYLWFCWSVFVICRKRCDVVCYLVRMDDSLLDGCVSATNLVVWQTSQHKLDCNSYTRVVHVLHEATFEFVPMALYNTYRNSVLPCITEYDFSK